MIDVSITCGGVLTAEQGEDDLCAELLRELRAEAERRGWAGARIVEVRRKDTFRQIEIAPAGGWEMDFALVDGGAGHGG